VLTGEWTLLGTPRPDICVPDWFLDPVTGRRAPQGSLAFRIDHRDEAVTGNVKAVWELSRHHHLTVLSAAWWLTGEDSYAELVADQLRSWWAANPFLSGVHWTSGIELGIRLTSWVWIRRLLDEWPGVHDLFEHDDALRQLWWHQRYLAAFRSRGSSANNHAVAEACGLLTAACALPWFDESTRWRDVALRRLQSDLRANTFPSGVNRELASDYHRFVSELGLIAAAETAAAGHPVEDQTWDLLTASLDVAAALVDVTGRPPRQGDGDEGRALVLDDPADDAWAQLLSLGAATVGPRPWWPAPRLTVAGAAVGALLPPRPATAPRPTAAPRTFADAGISLLRTPPEDGPEIWCRCDGGPHGFLSIAAHAHADALAVEVRYDGVDVLVDPGTYCYHGQPEWRSYFRSTRAHNTVEIDGENQSVEGGPFLWTRHAQTRVDAVPADEPRTQTWRGAHTGYSRLDATVVHRRTVTLDRRTRALTITDELSGTTSHTLRVAFHLGPAVTVDLSGCLARLSWPGGDGMVGAELHLPPGLRWGEHRGETDPVLGWFSPGFGRRVPTTTLVGTGEFTGTLQATSVLDLPRAAHAGTGRRQNPVETTARKQR